MAGQDGAGHVISVRLHPRAARARMEPSAAPGDPLRVHVTLPPETGKANGAVRKLLAAHLGVAPSRLTLLRGARVRDQRFRLD